MFINPSYNLPICNKTVDCVKKILICIKYFSSFTLLCEKISYFKIAKCKYHQVGT